MDEVKHNMGNPNSISCPWRRWATARHWSHVYHPSACDCILAVSAGMDKVYPAIHHWLLLI